MSGLVTTAARGRPAPSVLDSVRMSGTTASRWKAYQSPVRHRTVYASSRINSPPRSWGRYPFGVGIAKLPGAAGPYPLRPEL